MGLQWIAYCTSESGRNEIYVRPFPDVNRERRQVSTKGGSSPRWSPDGRELLYLNGDSVMAVAVQTEPTFSLGPPKTLFSGMHAVTSVVSGIPWDVHPDGKRFLMIKPPDPADDESAEVIPRKINIILNWFEELKERVPVY